MAEQEIPTPDIRFTPDRGDENKGEIGHGPGSLPYDLPIILRVGRHIHEPDKALLGWELDLNVLARGRVQIKIALQGGMHVLVDGEVVAKVAPQRDLSTRKGGKSDGKAQ